MRACRPKAGSRLASSGRELLIAEGQSSAMGLLTFGGIAAASAVRSRLNLFFGIDML